MTFQVNILCGKDVPTSSVTASGEASFVLRPDKFGLFGISDDLLKSAVEEYLGARPDSVYLGDPTPGDLYRTRNWEPVTARIRPASATVLESTTSPTQIAVREFINRSSKPADYDCSISADVTDVVESNWSNTLALGISQSINYGTMFVGGETSINLQTDFQTGGSNSQALSLGYSSGVMVNLEPDEKRIVTLTAEKGAMTVRVLFDVYLTGVVAAHFKGIYKWEHDWPVDIAGAFEAVKQSHKLTITNDVKIDYFSSGQIIVEDGTGKRLRILTPGRPRA